MDRSIEFQPLSHGMVEGLGIPVGQSPDHREHEIGLDGGYLSLNPAGHIKAAILPIHQNHIGLLETRGQRNKEDISRV